MGVDVSANQLVAGVRRNKQLEAALINVWTCTTHQEVFLTGLRGIARTLAISLEYEIWKQAFAASSALCATSASRAAPERPAGPGHSTSSARRLPFRRLPSAWK